MAAYGLGGSLEAPFTLKSGAARFDTTAAACLDFAQNPAADLGERLVAGSGVVRALMQYKIKAGKEANPHVAGIQRASDALVALGNEEIPVWPEGLDGTLPVVGEIDGRSMGAAFLSDPVRSAQIIDQEKQTEHVLLVGIGHGGTLPGALARGALKRWYDDEGSVFYPVRLSRDKEKDLDPQVSTEEVDYLAELSRDRQIVIIDDDSFGWNTILTAERYFNQSVLNHGRAVEWMVVRAGGTDRPTFRREFDGRRLPPDPYASAPIEN